MLKRRIVLILTLSMVFLLVGATNVFAGDLKLTDAITIGDIGKLLSDVVNNTNMGQQVNNWLFLTFFGLFFLFVYGSNVSSVSYLLQNILDLKPDWAIRFEQIKSSLLGQDNVIKFTHTTLTPFQTKDGGVFDPSVPAQWIIVLGVTVWAVSVLWEVFNYIRGRNQSNYGWGWLMAPVTLLIFLFAPSIIKAVGNVYQDITLQLVQGAQTHLGQTYDGINPQTFGNPLWILACVFGIADPKGGLNVSSIIGNLADNILKSATGLFSSDFKSSLLNTVAFILQNVLSPSVLLEILVMILLILVVVQALLSLIFINFYGISSILLVMKPFHHKQLLLFFSVTIRAVISILVVLVMDLAIAFVNAWGSVNGGVLFNSVITQIVNIVILAGVAYLLFRLITKPLISFVYMLTYEIKATGAAIHGFMTGSAHTVDSMGDVFGSIGGGFDRIGSLLSQSKRFAGIGGGFQAMGDRLSGMRSGANRLSQGMGNLGQSIENAASWPYEQFAKSDLDPSIVPQDMIPANMRENHAEAAIPREAFYDDLGQVEKRTETNVQGVYMTERFKHMRFNSPESAQLVARLVQYKGNTESAVNAMQQNQPLPDTIKIENNHIYLHDETHGKDFAKVMQKVKRYRRVGNRLVDDNGNAVPESVANGGIIL